MKFTKNWLLDYLEPFGSFSDIIEGLLNLGIEIEKVTDYSLLLNNFIVAEIISTTKHPYADKLQICQVKITPNEIKEIVCGAINAREGIKVIFAPLGSYIPGTGITLKETSIRGIKSSGMLLSEMELGLSSEHEGIIEIEETREVGTLASQALGLEDILIETSITPNLGYLLSVRNIAKSLAALGVGKFKDKTYPNLLSSIWLKNKTTKGLWKKYSNINNQLTVENNSENSILTPTLELNASEDICKSFGVLKITGVQNNNLTPLYIQQRLKLIGMKLISPLVDITNYLTIDINHPMHAYDATTLSKDLTVTFGNKEEELYALNNKVYHNLENIPVIKSNNTPIAIAGIIGGMSYSVNTASNHIVLECAHFCPTLINKASKLLNNITDSSYHFQRGVDYLDILYALNKALHLIIETCGGTLEEAILVQNYHSTTKTISTSKTYINNILGTQLSTEKIINYFTALGFKVLSKEPNLIIEVPVSREDLEQECDLAELILKCYGINNIILQPVFNLPEDNTNLSPNFKIPKSNYQLSLAIKKSLAALGLIESINLSFISKETALLFNSYVPALELLNPLSLELAVVRSTLIPSLIVNASNNTKAGYSDGTYFEVSNIYSSLTKSSLNVGGVLYGYKYKKNWQHKNLVYDTYDSKEVLFNLITNLGLNPDKFKITTHNIPPYYHPGKSGALLMGNIVLGYFGELHPKLTNHFKIKTNPAIFELYVNSLPLPKNKGAISIMELSNQMPLERDFAFILPDDTPAVDIIKIVANVNKQLISSVRIFDVFYLPNSKTKSIGISVTITPKTTLNDTEINTLCDQIISTVTNKLNGKLRLN